jgi:beta-lactamase regulating signal transducer with metallopeptidase domain/Flp pilus assembly protein TadD
VIAWLIGNSIVAAVAAAVVMLLCHLNRRRPELCHGLWLFVFVLLIAPPLPTDSHPGHVMRSAIGDWFEEAPVLTTTRAYPAVDVRWASAKPSFPEPAVFSGAQLDSLGADLAALAPAPETRFSVRGVVLGLGALALAALLAGFWFAARIGRFHRRVLASPRAVDCDPDLDDQVRRVAARLGVPVPEVRLVAGIGSPAVWCLGRARLLWPASLDAERPRIEPSVIAHELAHIARRDTWTARLEPLALILLFWHPLFWLVRSQVHRYAELSCDAWALWAYPTDRRAYAEALLGAQQENRLAPVPVRGLCATHPNVKDLERRLTLIMRDQVSRGASRAALFAAALGVLLVAPGLSQSDDDVLGSAELLRTIEVGQVQVELERSLIDVQIEGLEKKAESLFQEGDYPSSMEVFEEVVRLDPDNAFAHTRLGYIQIGLGMLEEARGHLQRQVELGENVPIARYNLACVASLLGDTNDAVVELAAAIRVGFADPELLRSDEDLSAIRGTRQFAAAVKLSAILRDHRAALRDPAADPLPHLVTIAKIASDSGEVFRDYGMALHERGNFKGSLKCFTRQRQLGFHPALAAYNQACAMAHIGDVDRAVQLLEEAGEMGFVNVAAADDPDLQGLVGHPGFEHALLGLGLPSSDKEPQRQIGGVSLEANPMGLLGEVELLRRRLEEQEKQVDVQLDATLESALAELAARTAEQVRADSIVDLIEEQLDDSESVIRARLGALEKNATLEGWLKSRPENDEVLKLRRAVQQNLVAELEAAVQRKRAEAEKQRAELGVLREELRRAKGSKLEKKDTKLQ